MAMQYVNASLVHAQGFVVGRTILNHLSLRDYIFHAFLFLGIH